MSAADRIFAARALIEPLTGHTRAPWKWWTSNSWRRLKHDSIGLTLNVLEPFVASDGHPDCSVSSEDMALIAAAPALRDTVAALADLADAQAQEIAKLREALAGERERIASNLDTEADVTPCAEDAAVVRSCARLVRADFSHEAADALGETP